ncbi:hypothetical protein AXF21_06640 [Eubacterium minutum ATCC 700079]|nr:hypothetical protein AXF21_06640 [Eubacterium minutum ATCC 700079]
MNNIPFVQSKLIIPDLPVRSLFCDRIKNMKITENRISTLTAPAGFGKTTAVLMCLEKYRQNVKWYRLDKEDCFLPVFYSHLMETLFSGEKIKDVSCIDMLKGLQNIDEDYILLNAQIVQDAFMVFGEFKKKIYLVLDDFHNVKNNLAVADTVRYLAMNLPECFSIVVTSRTETGIIGDKLFLRGDAVQINASEMLFSKEEMEKLIRTEYGVNLSKRQMELIFEVTEGWIAGISMVCHGIGLLTEGDDDFPDLKKGKSFFKTFLNRFLEEIDEDKKYVLVRLSTFEEFSAAELKSIFNLDHVEDFIRWIENSNLYIQKVNSYPAEYRFHSLFKDALEEYFYAFTEKEERIAFFRKVAEYYDAVNPKLAIRYFLLAEDKEKALGIIKSLSEVLFKNGNPEEMFYMISEFSADERRRDPYLLLFEGMTKVNVNKEESAEAFLSAIDGFKRIKDFSFLMNTFGMILVMSYQNNNFVAMNRASRKFPKFPLFFAGKKVLIKLLISIFIALTGTDKLACAGIFTRILDKVSIEDGMWNFSYLMIRGIYYYRRGFLKDAYANMKRILNHPVFKSNDQWRIIGLVSCCNVTFLRMDKECMQNFADEFFTLGEKYSSQFSEGYGHFITAFEKYRSGNVPDAIESMDNSIDFFKAYKGDLLVLESRLFHFLWNDRKPCADEIRENEIREDEIRKAEAALKIIRAENPGHGLVEFGECVVGVMERRRGNFENAESYFLDALRLCQKKKSLQSVAGLYMQLSYLHELWGHKDKALKYACEWDKLSSKYGYVYWREADKTAETAVKKMLGMRDGASDAPDKTRSDEMAESPNISNDHGLEVHIKLLGDFSIKIDDDYVVEKDFKTRKVSGILKYILIFGKDKYISREKLASIFWPESGAKAANTSLRVALYEMRKTLTQNGVGLESDKGFIIERKEGFRIKDDIRIFRDIDSMESLYKGMDDREKSYDKNSSSLRQICELYDGELLDGQEFDDSIIVLREYYSSIFFESLYKLLELCIERDSFEEFEVMVNKGLMLDPLNEKMYGMFIDFCKKTGRIERADYLKESFIKRFVDEMGVYPNLKGYK